MCILLLTYLLRNSCETPVFFNVSVYCKRFYLIDLPCISEKTDSRKIMLCFAGCRKAADSIGSGSVIGNAHVSCVLKVLQEQMLLFSLLPKNTC